MRDFGPRIEGSLQVWREANPNASSINISGRGDLTNDDFQYLRGIPCIEMASCSSPLKDSALSHLQGVRILNLKGCKKELTEFTPEGFKCLGEGGIEELDISGCDFITDECFRGFAGVKRLIFHNASGISDAAFVHLKGIQKLDLYGCTRLQISDAAFSHISGVENLDIEGLRAEAVTDEGFKFIADGIRFLDMSRMNRETISDQTFKYLAEGNTIRSLVAHRLDQFTITDEGLQYLAGIAESKGGPLHYVNVVSCIPYTVSEEMLKMMNNTFPKFNV